MAMHIPRSGLQQMLKDGAKNYQGLDEAVYRNISACKQLAETTRSAFGPNGMNKMVINHIEKLFVTNDAATIIKELEVQHPAAKMLVLASQQMEQEIGDGTNLVLILAGALLENAEELLRMGLSPTEVIEGYEQACKKALELLPDLSCATVKDLKDRNEVWKAIRTSVMSKQYGNEDFFSQLVADACISVMNKTKTFNVDNVRVAKILGSGMLQSSVIQGMVFKRNVEGNIVKADDAKIAVYSCPIDIAHTETKGTVLIKTAKELKNYSKGEENSLEEQIKAIADTGIKVVVAGGKVGDLALHFLEKYNLMAVRLMSKWDLRRLCRSIGAVPLPRMTAPTPDEMGHCDHVQISEIGDTSVIIFKQDKDENAVATVVLRGSTDNLMDDLERAIDDGVNTFKAFTKNNNLVPGAGAAEIELAKQLTSYGETIPGLAQYAVKKFAQSFEAIPRALADNAGVKATEVLSQLYAAHQDGQKNIGFDIDAEGAGVKDVVEAGILDSYLAKHWAVKLATNAAVTVLRVDQIIMAKRAGGPKPPQKQGNWDDQD
ncbi:T-complex protein 1 subunit theta-like [Antedon mediterranea]|uniref:T-complex protein 1 subunit theta-like n=1 Tax=Antedon mediterranea TaxID=105859 RepID=UPI003AF931B9